MYFIILYNFVHFVNLFVSKYSSLSLEILNLKLHAEDIILYIRTIFWITSGKGFITLFCSLEEHQIANKNNNQMFPVKDILVFSKQGEEHMNSQRKKY